MFEYYITSQGNTREKKPFQVCLGHAGTQIRVSVLQNRSGVAQKLKRKLKGNATIIKNAVVPKPKLVSGQLKRFLLLLKIYFGGDVVAAIKCEGFYYDVNILVFITDYNK